MQKPFYIYSRKSTSKGKVKNYFTYTITEASGLPSFICKEHYRKGISARNKSDAGQKVFDLIQALKMQTSRAAVGSFGDYSRNYMVAGKCPLQRLIESEGKKRDPVYMREYRNIYEQHVAADFILCGIELKDITHGDLLRFRERLVDKLGVCSTSRKAFKITKQITSYATRMGDIQYDPGAGMGDIKDTPTERGVFTMDEIRSLFPREGIGEWQDKQAFLAFLLVYSCGLRRGELLGLKWGAVLFDMGSIVIVEQLSARTMETKAPKKGKRRGCPVPNFTMDKLNAWHKETKFGGPEEYVFCYQKRFRNYLPGHPYGGTWWAKNFRWPLEKLGIDYTGRILTPHSLRHTANTQLLDKGYSRDKIRETLGWSSSGVQAIYTHGDAMDHKGQADMINSILVSNQTQ